MLTSLSGGDVQPINFLKGKKVRGEAWKNDEDEDVRNNSFCFRRLWHDMKRALNECLIVEHAYFLILFSWKKLNTVLWQFS